MFDEDQTDEKRMGTGVDDVEGCSDDDERFIDVVGVNPSFLQNHSLRKDGSPCLLEEEPDQLKQVHCLTTLHVHANVIGLTEEPACRHAPEKGALFWKK